MSFWRPAQFYFQNCPTRQIRLYFNLHILYTYIIYAYFSRIEANTLLQEEAKKLQSEIKVSTTIARTLLMRNKWVLKDALKAASEMQLADKITSSSRPGECDGRYNGKILGYLKKTKKIEISNEIFSL